MGNSRNSRMANIDHTPVIFETVLGQSLHINGDIVTINNMRIAGRINGNVNGEQTIIVDSTGVVNGNITSSDTVIIGGEVTGDINSQHVTLQSTCILKGTISYITMTVESGAKYEGAVSQKIANPPTSHELA